MHHHICLRFDILHNVGDHVACLHLSFDYLVLKRRATILVKLLTVCDFMFDTMDSTIIWLKLHRNHQGLRQFIRSEHLLVNDSLLVLLSHFHHGLCLKTGRRPINVLNHRHVLRALLVGRMSGVWLNITTIYVLFLLPLAGVVWVVDLNRSGWCLVFCCIVFAAVITSILAIEVRCARIR